MRRLQGHTPAWLCFVVGGVAALGYAPLYLFPLYIAGWAWFLKKLHEAPSLRSALVTSFFFGYGHWFVGLYWVVFSLGVDWHKYWSIAPLLLLGLPLLFVGWHVLAFGFYHQWLRHSRVAPLWVTLAWFAADMCRSYALTGFPWNLPANVWTFSPALISLTAWVGAYGLSLLTCAFVAYSWWFFQQNKRFLIMSYVFVLLIVSAIQMRLPETTYTDLKVHLVQPNISQVAKMDMRYARHILQKLHELSDPPTSDGHLVIWPEGALPFAFDLQNLPEGMTSYWESLARKSNTVLVSGVRMESQPKQRIFNSVVQINPRGQVVAHFDKVHLLPFGEFMPLRSLLPKLLADLAVGSLDMTAGAQGAWIRLKSGYRFKPLICFESLFSELIENAEMDGLVIVTNDAWFGNSSGPYQHLSSAQLRAAEFGVPVLRVANTGISAIIDAYGRIVHAVPYHKEGTISALLPQKRPATFFAQYRWGGVFVIFVMLFLLQFLPQRARKLAVKRNHS